MMMKIEHKEMDSVKKIPTSGCYVKIKWYLGSSSGQNQKQGQEDQEDQLRC